MLTIHVVCVGKLKESYLREAQAEYAKRLSAFCRLDVIEIAECRLPDSPSEAQIRQGLEKEGRDILFHAKGMRIALCIEGREYSSTELAKELAAATIRGDSELSFLIGGSFGLSEEVKHSSALRLSMSPMTFPHQLARVMLLEQLYRACSINANGKYHK